MTEVREAAVLTVGQVAEAVGVTVRTLHHYDDIGLVRPGARSASGYRLYTDEDVERLQNVVVYRRLGFALEEIELLLAAPGSDLGAHLRRQRAAVMTRLDELHSLVAALDKALEKERNGMDLTRDEQRELFGDGFDEAWATEARDRWGETDAWRQSRERAKRYTKVDWERITAEGEAVNSAFVAAMAADEPATGEVAMDAAEAARAHIERWFYDLTPELHRSLAEMYVTDPRFTRTYEGISPGLARYVRDAIHANADRAARGSAT